MNYHNLILTQSVVRSYLIVRILGKLNLTDPQLSRIEEKLIRLETNERFSRSCERLIVINVETSMFVVAITGRVSSSNRIEINACLLGRCIKDFHLWRL